MATPASEWLISFLEADSESTTTLLEVMEYADFVIADDYGNNYRLGTGSFAWAFEVALWHHANLGVIVPACDSTEQEEIWSDFVGQSDRPSRPSPFDPSPIWDVPFRLAEMDADAKLRINHVGRVGCY